MAKKQNTQEDRLLEEVTSALKKENNSFAIGLDMAADEKNWGICFLSISPDLTSADLPLLLPQAKENKNGQRSKTRFCRPSFPILESILQAVAKSKQSGSMGVDIPFGWPVEHRVFVNQWLALEGWDGQGRMPVRENFEKRLCDVELHTYEPSIDPFAVGADTIAQAAYKWAACRDQLSPTLVGNIDFGLEPITDDGLTTFESYPGAFVQLAYPDFSDYKSKNKKEVRRQLHRQLQQDYPINDNEQVTDWLEWAINQKGKSPDAFDALLCAITAWAHLRWKNNPNDNPVTTPARVLGQAPSRTQASTIRREGWILIPDRPDVP